MSSPQEGASASVSSCRSVSTDNVYTVSQKGYCIAFLIALVDIDGFSQFFLCRIHQEICNSDCYFVQQPAYFKSVATLTCEATVITNKSHFHIKTIHSTSVMTNKMSFYDEIQMQVAKTVQNVPLLHGHWHEVVNATGRLHC